MPDSICAAIIGKGRVATTLGRAWESSGLSIGAFCNRSHEIPDGFTTLDALCVEDCSQLPSDINVAMIAVSDDAVPAIIDQLPSGIFSIHFSGSESIDLYGSAVGGEFHATEMLMKCPSKYNENNHVLLSEETQGES